MAPYFLRDNGPAAIRPRLLGDFEAQRRPGFIYGHLMVGGQPKICKQIPQQIPVEIGLEVRLTASFGVTNPDNATLLNA